MKTFLEHTFADLHAGKSWTDIPLNWLRADQHMPAINIDTELFDLLDNSYAYIGGHVDFQRPSDIPGNHTIWYGIDIDDDPAPDAVRFAKNTPFGIKWTGGATDGSSAAKAAYLASVVNTLRAPGNYCEMSDAIMHIMITRYGITCVNNQIQVEKILGKSVKWVGEHPAGKYPGYTGFYIRELGGVDHMKLLLGRPRIR